ncbi:hypothetical protein RJ639_007050 [Escallonia herrerae]|uniref:Coenzyme Q-binding protein COQ10 START domain-containing protein n=1 Tax=Escallonia herrerae TaxID=1293975 RepID=A0AA88VYU1_9ASTE|nr:hypothetical protein RJ639_007050 [Escallonia herrerae]
MQMHAFPNALLWYSLPPLLYVEASRSGVHAHALASLFPVGRELRTPISQSPPPTISSVLSPEAFNTSLKRPLPRFCRLSPNSSDVDSITLSPENNDGNEAILDDEEHDEIASSLLGIEIEIEKVGNNCRRIRSKATVEASLQTVWNILTDYERLADFIPGLAVSQLVEKRDNFARLFQIGQQSLAFGLKFNAKGVVDCYEKDLETLPFGQRRDIEFKMIEGDFKLFEGKWSIEQHETERREQIDYLVSQEFHTTLSYVVDVEPKLWLPVRLVEGRLCREITTNLSCIREEAQKAFHKDLPL